MDEDIHEIRIGPSKPAIILSTIGIIVVLIYFVLIGIFIWQIDNNTHHLLKNTQHTSAP